MSANETALIVIYASMTLPGIIYMVAYYIRYRRQQARTGQLQAKYKALYAVNRK